MTRTLVTRARARRGLTLTATLVVALLGVAAAVAYFTTTGTGMSSATVGTLDTPVITSVVPGAGTVSLDWAPGVAPPGAGPVGYYVERNGGDAAGCPTAASPTGVTSCTDTNPPAGRNTYTVTAVWRSWTATSDPASETPLSAPTVTAVSPSSRGQGAANQSVVISGTGFVSGATVSFSGGGIIVNSATFDSATQITANISVAAGAPVGASNVTVTNPDTGAGTQVSGFTVNTGPTVASATPPSRAQGTSSQDIVIAGTGFVTGAAASFSGTGITVNSTTVNTSAELIANITIAAGTTVGTRDITVTNPDGGTGVGTGVFTVDGSLTGVSANPSYRNQGALNQNIVITGSGFLSGAVVTFSGSGITINSTTVDSGTQITVNITIAGTATTGAGDITVTNPGGASVTGTGVFTVNPAPTLTSASPSSRGRGATNQDITLTGTGFIDGATLAASFGSLITVNSTTFVNETTLTANITVGATAATGPRSVTVTSADGSTALGTVFAVNAAPTVTSATPSSRGQGAVSQNIAIAGTGFVAGAAVSFSGSGITVNSTTFNTATSLTANITIADGAATGLRDVIVTNPDAGVGTRVGGFTVNTGPTVASATPASRGQGATNQNIVITGTGYAAGAVASFSGTGITVTSTTFNSATQVTAGITVAAGAPVGARDVVVTNTDGGRGTSAGLFTVAGSPTVTSVSPGSRGRGASNQTVVITGTNFVSGATVSFSGPRITVNSTAYVSSTSLTANISIAKNAATGLRNVIVDNNNGGTTGTCTGCFTVSAAPSVTSVTSGSRGQGAVSQNIAIVGTGFVSGAVASFSGTGITVNSTTFVSATSLTVNIAIAPGAPTGNRDVTVTNVDGGTGSRNNAFSVSAGPTVTSVSPASRPQGALNQVIVITGTGFASGAIASFSGAGITVNSTTFTSATQITVNISIAAGATLGACDVTVTNANGGAGTRTAAFTVT